MSIKTNSLTNLASAYSDSDDEEGNLSVQLTKQTSEYCDGNKTKRTRNDTEDYSPNIYERETRIKLEIPTGILDMFKPTDISTGSGLSSQHQGRVRSFDHFAGNWATHVLMPINLPEHFSEFVSSLKNIWPENAPELHIDLNDVHVSISRTVPIRHHWISPLKEFLQRGFSGKRSFILDFPTINVYVNDENTRSFLALDVNVGIMDLKKLVVVVDKAFGEFGLPQYYEQPSFHASFSWSLGNIKEFFEDSTLTKMQALLDSYVEDNSPLVFTAEEIQCRTGNKVFYFSLNGG